MSKTMSCRMKCGQAGGNVMSRRSVVVAFALLAGSGTAALAQAQAPALPELPDAIRPGTLKPYLAVAAKGVQIYVCRKADSGQWTWTFKGPEADLHDLNDAPMGKHYGGPTWEGVDGGKVVGAVKASADAPTGNGIPWLWLDVKSREGKGVYTEATGILRVATVSGKAPATGCDEAHAGTEQRVPYTARYFFLK
jgi:hypothetical protein